VLTRQAEGAVDEIQRELESLEGLSWWRVVRKHELKGG